MKVTDPVCNMEVDEGNAFTAECGIVVFEDKGGELMSIRKLTKKKGVSCECHSAC